MIKKWALVIVIFALAVFAAGCCGVLTNAANESSLKQAAYDNMVSKQMIVENLTDDYNQMSLEIASMNYSSDPSDFKATLNKDTTKIDRYINALMEYKGASQLYAAHLDPNSKEYRQVDNNVMTCDDNIQKAQDEKNNVATISEWIGQFETWNQSAGKLMTQMNGSKNMSTGGEYHTWLLETRPILDTYLSDCNAFINGTDRVIPVVESETTREQLLQMKSMLQTGNDQIKASYNKTVDFYNTNFGRTYGDISPV